MSHLDKNDNPPPILDDDFADVCHALDGLARIDKEYGPMGTPIAFIEVVVERGGRRVTWEDIGEGISGDYNEDDPGDTPLLRFSCDKYVDGEWQELQDASYCTALPTNTPLHRLLGEYTPLILEALEQPSPKRALEACSWMGTE